MADLSSLLGAAGIGGAIGKAIVSLELETTKYQAELKAAQAQTVASTNASSQAVGNFGKFASTALLGVGVAAVAGAAMSVKAAIEANEAHIKLQNTFDNNAKLSDSSVAAFERQADALRDLTGVDDEAIISGQALLGQFNLTGKQVLKLTPLIVDLSEKMGIDMEAAAKAVGKATEGNTGSLARYIGAIEEGKTPLETFTNITDKLGRVQGFAAERADAEPWRVLGAQFEEVAENIGQALLPLLQSIVPVLQDIVTILGFATRGFKDFDQAVKDAALNLVDVELHVASWAERMVGSIPIIGNVVDQVDRFQAVTDASSSAVVKQRDLIGDLSDFYRDKLFPAVGDTTKQIVQFAGKTSAEIKEWSDDVKKSFDTFVLTLEESEDAAASTARGFAHGITQMLRDARELARAMNIISKEKWVNDEFIAFISEQGPDWLIGFSKLNETAQRKFQEDWKVSTEKTDEAKASLDKITGVLDKLDKGESKHKVIIEYDYVGFDPSKPGMSSNNNTPSETRRP